MKRIIGLLTCVYLFVVCLMLSFDDGGSPSVVLRKHFYVSDFDTTRFVPLYTEYWLTKAHEVGTYDRTPFKMDTSLPKRLQSNGSEYNDIYDRGHLAPDDDFRFDSIAQAESMLYTNAAPQVKSFNRGLWRMVENYTRKVALQYDSVFVTTGCIYSDKKLGKLSIPDYYYKILVYKGHKEEFLAANKIYAKNDISLIRLDLTKDSVEGRLGYKLINFYN